MTRYTLPSFPPEIERGLELLRLTNKNKPLSGAERRRALELVEQQADMTLVNSFMPTAVGKGTNALLRAIKYGHLELVAPLLAAGADPNAKDDHNQTPLFYAVIYGHRSLLPLLIAHGADVNWKDEFGTTALNHVAAHEEEIQQRHLQDDDSMLFDRTAAAAHHRELTAMRQMSEQLIEAGALMDHDIPMNQARRDLYHAAQHTIQALMEQSPIPLDQLTPPLLCQASNVGQLDVLLAKVSWHGDQAELTQLLAGLPPYLANHVIHTCHAATHQIASPDAVIELPATRLPLQEQSKELSA